MAFATAVLSLSLRRSVTGETHGKVEEAELRKGFPDTIISNFRET